jgi:hypothetical protein
MGRIVRTAFATPLLLAWACAPRPAPADPGVGAGTTAAEPARAEAATPAPAPPRPDDPAGVFAAKVRPILAQRCDPCHNPGGRMYERLPFDDPGVVSGHLDGVLRRLKDTDRETVASWAASLSGSGRP